MTVGVKVCMNWQKNNDGKYKKKSCVMKTKAKGTDASKNVYNIVVAYSSEGLAYTGNSDGSIAVWSGNSQAGVFKIHDKAVHSVRILSKKFDQTTYRSKSKYKENDFILTGSADQTVILSALVGKAEVK